MIINSAGKSLPFLFFLWGNANLMGGGNEAGSKSVGSSVFFFFKFVVLFMYSH
jgi:hypothetical protein